jgi:hypothetical protein
VASSSLLLITVAPQAKENFMPRHPSARTAKSLALLLGNLLLGPLLGFGQETVPVTIIVQFEQPVPETLVGTGGGDLGASTISAAGTSTFTVFNQVILPKAESRSEQEAKREEVARRLPTRPRTFGGTFRYEHVDFDNEASGLGGDIYTTNFQMAWDIENFSLGFLIPYEYLDLKSFNVHQTGAILYGQYNLHLSPIYTVGFTVNGNYIYSAIDHNLDNVNTFGGGLGVSLTYDKDVFVLGGAVSYQYNSDDTDSPNDHQHLIKIGANVGVRIGQKSVVNLFSSWNYDATNYKQIISKMDDNYFDLGIEASWNITTTWSLNGGYKRILGLTDFESNQFYVGTLLRF